MNIKKIIDTEKWNAEIFDSAGKHNLAPYHNASLDRIEAAAMKRIRQLESCLVDAMEGDSSNDDTWDVYIKIKEGDK